jgi:glucose-1-phosphate adenylyltransferase
MTVKIKNKEIQIASIVLAGGKGERLYPLTLNHSKPAITYGGRYRLIDIPISNSLNSSVNEIYVIAQYLPLELQKHLNETYKFNSSFQGKIDFLTPKIKNGSTLYFQGTADAIRKNLKKILKKPFEYLLVLSGDQLYNIDFEKMISWAIEKDADLTIASLPVTEKDASRFGILKIDETATVLDFIEKPKEKEILAKFKLNDKFFNFWQLPNNSQTHLASMGIYVFKRAALESLLKEKGDDFGKNLIPIQLQRGKTAAFVYDGYWEDIGTVDSYFKANQALTGSNKTLQTYDEFHPIYSKINHLPGTKINNTLLENSIICEGSLIEAKEIKNSVVGLRSIIKKNTVITDSILMGNNHYENQNHAIGENCFINKAIIDEGVVIKNNVKLFNKNNYTTYDGPGIYVRDGIIIVTAKTTLEDNFEF